MDAQANSREQFHGLFGGDHGRAAQGADCPGDAVVFGLASLLQQHRAGVALVLQNHRDHFADLDEQARLRLAERHLIADLVEVAAGPAAFSVQPADDEVDLLQGLENFLDLLGDTEGREVEHHAGAHAGADVRGASGEEAESVVEGVGQSGFEVVVDRVDLLPSFVERQPRAHDLDAKMILFVDHDADRLAGVEGHAARPFEGVGEFAADELPLDEEEPVERHEAHDAEVFEPRRDVRLGHGLADALFDLGLLVVVGARGEGDAGEVACQPDARGDDDIGLRAGAAQPLAEVGE